MATYGMPYREVMGLPIRVFWSLAGFAPRIAAEKAQMDLQIAVSAQSPEGVKEMAQRLTLIAPDPVKRSTKAIVMANAQKDVDGIARLRALMV